MLCIVLNRVIAIQVWARGIAKKDIPMPVDLKEVSIRPSVMA
jgi:hypothetical protein